MFLQLSKIGFSELQEHSKGSSSILNSVSHGRLQEPSYKFRCLRVGNYVLGLILILTCNGPSLGPRLRQKVVTDFVFEVDVVESCENVGA